MRRLVFIDDDEAELKAFRNIIGDSYEYTTVHWPAESAKLFSDPNPDLFVSDLYLPPRSGGTNPTADERRAAAAAAVGVSDSFSRLYMDPACDDKARLRVTMGAIDQAYHALKLQWSALGQSPDNGVALYRELRTHYPAVPLVFYSRKITPEDVIRVLEVGAVDAIRKGALKNEEVLARLARAQQRRRAWD